jgi:hypothetical protein
MHELKDLKLQKLVQEKEVGLGEGMAGEVVVPRMGVQQKMPWAERLAAVQQQERKQSGEA